MLHEALTAAETLRARVRGCAWSTCRGSTASTATGLPRRSRSYADVFVLEDHAPVGGLGDALLRELSQRGCSTTER